ncbi:A-kinase anchor protein 7-like [Saccostrea echinata]|uniref:A-kinase anchor protein 7-like n=1 Tax=Saccostrea echinata TaxID=191078 RepID=UPI002A81832B|nr:A-kinase anchor protein 7-like [Saccostrea echinata]
MNRFQDKLRNFSPLTLTVSTMGNFEDQVVYAAVTDNQRLNDLVEDLRESFQRCGFLVTDERFNPHVTICKITARSRERGINRIEPSYYQEKTSAYFGQQDAKSIQLCSMAKPKSESGYYHVEHEIYF